MSGKLEITKVASKRKASVRKSTVKKSKKMKSSGSSAVSKKNSKGSTKSVDGSKTKLKKKTIHKCLRKKSSKLTKLNKTTKTKKTTPKNSQSNNPSSSPKIDNHQQEIILTKPPIEEPSTEQITPAVTSETVVQLEPVPAVQPVSPVLLEPLTPPTKQADVVQNTNMGTTRTTATSLAGNLIDKNDSKSAPMRRILQPLPAPTNPEIYIRVLPPHRMSEKVRRKLM